MKLKTVLQIIGCIAIAITLLPIVAIDYWWIRIFDFPHIQLTLFTGFAILIYFIKFDFSRKRDYAFIVILLACLGFQLSKLLPFTSIWKKEVHDSTANSDAPKFSIYLSNVLQYNKNRDKLVEAIKKEDADMIYLMETHQEWLDAVADVAREKYPYKVEKPMPNAYGMLLYSKFPLMDTQVKYVVDDSVPSIHTLFTLPSGDTIQLYCIHPTPPMPQHNPRSSDRDAEMMLTGLAAYEAKHPVIVMGDFNDVSWSSINGTFKEIGQLLDVRRGRGVYNSYHTEYFFARWPLDHFYLSEHFRVADFTRKPSVDSDHFPLSITLTYEPDKAAEQRADPPSEKQLEKARQQIRKEERWNDK